jgi:hypothetical protein
MSAKYERNFGKAGYTLSPRRSRPDVGKLEALECFWICDTNEWVVFRRL